MQLSNYQARLELRNWVSDATKLIKFAPDREHVYNELFEHMEDAMDAYISAGYTHKEACQKTVEAMGDSNKVAENMAMIYRPFWGYLWKATRILSIIAVIILIINCINFIFFLFSKEKYDYNDYFLSKDHGNYETKLNIYPKNKVNVGDYTVSVPRIDIKKYDSNSIHADFVLKVEHINPWLRGPMFYRYVYSSDNLGNVYSYRDYEIKSNSDSETCGNISYTGLFASYYEMWISYLDPNATEITIRFDGYGQSFALNIPIDWSLENEE